MYIVGKQKEFMEFSIKMMDESERLKTFKTWVFDETKACSSAKLAEAGFYFNGSDKDPDSVQCFLCCKSLEGWEETDDPWIEHLKHAPHCDFVKNKKPVKKLTPLEFLSMLEVVVDKCVDKMCSENENYLTELFNDLQRKVNSLKK